MSGARTAAAAAAILLLGFATPARTSVPIIGGEPANPGELPWQVSIQEVGKLPTEGHRCGGSIYAATWIVTAAHCVDDVTKDEITVAAGRVELKPGIRLHRVKRILIHRDYVPAVIGVTPPYHDIALLELETRIKWRGRQRPIALLGDSEEQTSVADWTRLTVSGWGVTHPASRQTETWLRKVKVPFVTTARCNRPEAYNGQITDEMICAGYAAGGMDACSFDSGGPLALVRPRRRALLVGIVSWGEGCAQPNKYGVYARVARYRAWIEEMTAPSP